MPTPRFAAFMLYVNSIPLRILISSGYVGPSLLSLRMDDPFACLVFRVMSLSLLFLGATQRHGREYKKSDFENVPLMYLSTLACAAASHLPGTLAATL